MFGYRAAFVNGNLFMSLFEDRMVLRLPHGPRAELLAMEGADTFEPMAGRPMKEYVLVPASVLAAPEALDAWVATALAYGGALPATGPQGQAKAKPHAKRPRGPRRLGRHRPGLRRVAAGEGPEGQGKGQAQGKRPRPLTRSQVVVQVD